MKFSRAIDTPPGLSRQRLASWDISYLDIGIYVCFAIACSVAAAAAVSALIGLESDSDLSSLSLTHLFAIGGAAQAGGLIGWFAFRKICPTENKNRPAELPEIVATALAAIILVYLILAVVGPLWLSLLDLAGYIYVEQDLVTKIRDGGSLSDLIMMGILIIVIAPVCEEIAYRGALYRFMNGKMPAWLAVTLPSFLFSISHANVYASVPLFILGIALCLVYKRTGSLFTSMLVHALFNTVTFVGLLNPQLFSE